ncbi:MAG: hypothetical protein ACOYLF_12145 [Blastocatellia bacterium]
MSDKLADIRNVKVELQNTAFQETEDVALWKAIRNRTEAIGFGKYKDFINRLLCSGTDTTDVKNYGQPSIKELNDSLAGKLTIHGIDAYQLLKQATQAFLIFETGIRISPERDPATGIEPAAADDVTELQGRLEEYLSGTGSSGRPYLKIIAKTLLGTSNPDQGLPYCNNNNILRNRFSSPSLLELIWSYWHEEGMLVQSLNAISLRFQNKRSSNGNDPLAALEIDPLRPLNNLLWGFIQDEQNRLTINRRAYEYDHAYGLSMIGRAVSKVNSVDSRSKFIEAFHNLLYRASIFYRLDSDTTVVADGFPLLNSLKEVHLLLAEGAHNQYGDLPWTARVEMLMMQWLLSRPEMREFIRGRAMVPYREEWMGQVDTMKKLQGWSDTSITHFHNLAVFGEQILLSVRFGSWNDINDQNNAKNWAREWRPEIQNYIHSFMSACSVDLTAESTDPQLLALRRIQPSVLLHNRLVAQRSHGQRPERIAASGSATGLTSPGRRARRLNPDGNSGG